MNVKQRLVYGKDSIKHQHTNKQDNLTLKDRLFVLERVWRKENPPTLLVGM